MVLCMKHDLTGVNVARVATIPFFVIAQLKSQLEILLASGAEVTVIASEDTMAKDIQQHLNIQFTPITIRREIAPFKDLKTLYMLWREYRKSKYTIIHSTTPKAGLLSAIAAFLARSPIRLHTFTGQPWVTMRGHKRSLLRFCDWLIVRLNTQCYADSHSQKSFLVEEKIAKKNDIKVLGKGSLAGVNLQRFNTAAVSESCKDTLRTSLQLSTERPVFLFLGRITEDKGVFELLDATAKLLDEGYDFDVLIVGPFEQFIEQKIRRKAHAISKNKIQFTGFCDKPQDYLAIANVLCLPSYREGFGTVVIEAAAMGVPTIGTSIYGLSDAIEDGETGLLVKPRSVEDLTDAMRRMIENPELRNTMGAHAKIRAVTHFDSHIIGTLLIDEYRALLKKTG